MWEKIVLNLLSNAMKFTFEGRVKVSLKELPSEVEFTVEDSGTGISKEELPKIFNRFHRVEGARSRTFEGSGIGLAIVQDMVKLHSGKINVESTEGKGSLFRITIPKGSSHLPADNLKTKAVPNSQQFKTHGFIEEASRWVPEVTNDTAFSYISSTVLVVDDNADMREYLTHVLGKDYNVLAASNGREALHIVKASQPDLIISDIMMPEMNGFELLKELRLQKTESRIPVIFLSARAGKEATVEGLEAGADDYLIKPFSSKELTARVKTQLSLVALKSELESERKALLVKDEHLREANNKLQESNTSLSQFAHIASHDLQEPIRKISSFAKLLGETLGDIEESKRYLENIDHSASKMSLLIKSLLNFSELSKAETVVEQVDLNKIIENIKNDFDLLIKEKKAVIQCSTLPIVNAISSQMTQLFSNLLTNSLKYVEKDIVPFISITSSLLSEEELVKHPSLNSSNTYYKVEFKDNGIGIEDEYSEKVFEMFHRLHSESDYSGTGIGLAICKKITQNHHGDIYITSGNSQGSIFNVILPVK
jgi:signal transduction histidine kinase